MANAASTIMGVVPAVVITTEVAHVIKGKGAGIKPVVGGFFLGVFLFGIAAINNDLAVGFAVLILLGSLLVNGATVGSALQKQFSK